MNSTLEKAVIVSTEENPSQTHTLYTLWSETLFEMLYDAIQYEWSGNAMREILRELHLKGYKHDRVMKKVRKRFGDEGIGRLMRKIKEQ